jgi:ribosomal protein S18 acetylase RimI-like enzyme
MIPLDPPLRLASEGEGRALAVLINEASHGLALHAWRTKAAAGADPWSIGIAQQSARARDGRWVVVDEGAGPVAGLMVLRPAVDPWPADLSPIFRPMLELEALAPDALYVNVVAALPEARGRGLGTRLLRVAEEIARAEGRPRLSLIVADRNAGARRLYARAGYLPKASRPMVKAGWDGPGTDWLLLVRDLP